MLRFGYRVPLSTIPSLSSVPLTMPSYSPTSVKGQALEKELGSLLQKGAIEPAPPGPGFYSRMFVVSKASGGWRPIIDLSTLNTFVERTRFRMETVQSVLSAIRQNDWMCSVDLKDAYLQVPIHQDSRKYLRFVTSQGAFQFRSLCFGLSTAPQVFTRVMAPVAVILHRLGVRILRYLDDWLILAATKEQCLRARDIVLQVCSDLGIQINWDKSILTPSQETTYLGILIDSRSFTASPSPKRRDRLRSLVREFLSLNVQPASLWRSLLGHLASLTQLIPGGRLRTRSLQLALRNQWDFQDESALISWSPRCKEDLVWWVQERLDLGTSLLSLPPDQALWSDASDVGWGAYLESQGASGRWTSLQKSWSINRRELRAVFLGLQAFEPFLSSRIALFCDNTTAVAYLRNQGGTLSESLNEEAQSILRWAEERGITLIPQFILGAANVLADSLSRPNQVLGSEWTLHQEVVDSLLRKWSANVDLFATSLNFRLQAYFAPLHDPQALAVDSFLQDWSGLEAYAFPPFPLIRRVLNKARQSPGLVLTLIAPMWPQKEWFPDLLQVLLEPPLKLPARRDLLRQPHFHRFHLGLDSLQLHAWRLSGGLPDRLVSPDVWLSS